MCAAWVSAWNLSSTDKFVPSRFVATDAGATPVSFTGTMLHHFAGTSL
jgi:hypothetical protein